MDRAVTAEAVAAAVSKHHGLLVVGTGTGVHEMADDDPTAGSQVDVVVVDGAEPKAVAARIADARARWEGASVVLLDGLDTVAELVEAVRAATGDLTVLTADAVARARAQLRSSTARSPVLAFRQLTPREREVLVLLSRGASPVQIAHDLHISVNTCRGYLRSMMTKLGAHSQREVVAMVAEYGLPADQE